MTWQIVFYNRNTRNISRKHNYKRRQDAAGLQALVVICYRRTAHTYAVPARNVLEWVERAANGGRKSIPEEFCINHGTPVSSRQLRVNWRYDVAGMMEALGGESHARAGSL